MQTVYLIQGYFFQNRQSLGLGYQSGEGVVAMVHRGMCRDMFAGVIYADPELLDDLSGTMQDAVGTSRLTNIFFDGKNLDYTKRYDGRRDDIEYTYRLEDGLWIGSFIGEHVGQGEATCMLTVAQERLFDCPDPMRAQQP